MTSSSSLGKLELLLFREELRREKEDLELFVDLELLVDFREKADRMLL